jgi:hypothetical protein
MDPNRLGIFNKQNKLLKDRLALVCENKDVVASQELLVKDLGSYPFPPSRIVMLMMGRSANFLAHRLHNRICRPNLHPPLLPLPATVYLLLLTSSFRFATTIDGNDRSPFHQARI